MIEIKGVIEYQHLGHSHSHVVVSVDGSPKNVRHEVGIDIELNRGRILTFLKAFYSVGPGDIVWPGHIIIKDGDLDE